MTTANKTAANKSTKAKSVRKPKPVKHMVIDAGNGNTKVSLAGESEIIPSLLSQNDGDYIRGGFRLADESWIMGWDNANRSDAIVIAEKETGKLDYLHLLLAGALSSLRYQLEPGDKIAAHVLTLNQNRKAFISEAVAKVAGNLSVDGEPLKLDVKLADVYPEGYGASLYAGAIYSNCRRVAVLDCGNGTLNLSQYHQSYTGLPRRESFAFVPYGIHSIVQTVTDLLVSETSNGRVDETLVRQALDSNSYLYLSNYKGIQIWEHANKAVDIWSEQPKVKQLLVQCLRLITAGVPVVLVGGGFTLHAMQQKVTGILTSQGKEELVHVADSPLTIGVDGLAQRLAA